MLTRRIHAMRLTLAVLLPCCGIGLARADTLRVGVGEPFMRIGDAAGAAKDGDIVEIMPGEYRADVAVWKQKQLTIRGVGERPILIVDGASAEGKAIWVIRNGDFVVENIEFRGARVPHGNGAGIRFERGRLQVRDSVFVDNQTGILTGNDRSAELAIEACLFADAPRQEHSLPHLLYVGRIARFRVTGSRFHNGYRGHLVKSRAQHSEVRYNLIVDGPTGAASYELEFPDGGSAVVVGNVIAQSALSPNRSVVAYAAEGRAWPHNRLLLAHNTLVSEGSRPARFTRIWNDRAPATEVVVRNNLAAGSGVFERGLPGEHAANFSLPADSFDAGTLDFALPADSPLRGRARRIAGEHAGTLTPSAEFSLPLGTVPLAPVRAWTPGAFQRPARLRAPAGSAR